MRKYTTIFSLLIVLCIVLTSCPGDVIEQVGAQGSGFSEGSKTINVIE